MVTVCYSETCKSRNYGIGPATARNINPGYRARPANQRSARKMTEDHRFLYLGIGCKLAASQADKNDKTERAQD